MSTELETDTCTGGRPEAGAVGGIGSVALVGAGNDAGAGAVVEAVLMLSAALGRPQVVALPARTSIA